LARLRVRRALDRRRRSLEERRGDAGLPGRPETRTRRQRDREPLTDEARRQEALFTGLRLTAGIDGGNFLRRFGVDPWVVYGGTLAPVVDDGLMWRDGARFGLTRRGMLVANEILATFV
jgi:coproporphyrinogen III oxidase-like Fe-S oxidoreductase